jgi:hypothetical protein
MAKYTVALQRIWRAYEDAGNPTPATSREVARWAIDNHLWEPPRAYDPIDQCAEDLARAWREEYRVDDKGRRYRAKHAVRVTKGGAQFAFWADMDTAPAAHVHKAIAQRRQQIVGDCYQLKVDVDHFNDIRGDAEPIQLILDFTIDVEELQGLEDIPAA